MIHALHHEQDMRKMGGIWKIIPVTYIMMIVGTLALTGIGIPGTKIGFAGFFSKDAIIEAAYAGGTAQAAFAFWAGVVAALMTSFYSWRLIFMTFHGKHRGEKEVLDHAHESPLVMLVPLFVLGFGALVAGFVFYSKFLGVDAAGFWNHALPVGDHAQLAPTDLYAAAETGHASDASHGGGHHDFPAWVLWAPLIVSVLGFILAWFMYIFRDGTEKRIAGEGGPLYNFLLNKWYIDELYEATIIRFTRFLGDVFWKVGDVGIIDRFGPNGVAGFAMATAKRVSKFQSGYLFHYAFVMLLGVAVIIALVFRTVGG